ncbi:MAG: hypothetical protein M3256_21815, partial [Actinomycetota bacterium]|nr:hypothetical protein [Actinomycetota bacterium]
MQRILKREASTTPLDASQPGNSNRSVARALQQAAFVVVVVGGFVSAVRRSYWLRSGVSWLEPKLMVLSCFGLVVTLVARPIVRARWKGRFPRPKGPVVAMLAAPAALSASMVVFMLPVIRAWQAAGSNIMVGGVLPMSDSQLYFGGAERLLMFGRLDVYNSRRPLNAMGLAVELAITHLDLRLTLLLQACLLGAACYLATRAVARRSHALPAAALFITVFAGARSTLPTTQSEVLGLTFGLLAFAAIFNALHTRDRRMIVGGMLLLAVALAVRAGPIAVPALLALWFARYRRGSRLLDWRLLGASSLALLVGTALPFMAVVALRGTVANVYGEGGFMFHGLAVGYPGWDPKEPGWLHIYVDHPEIIEMSDVQRNRFVMSQFRRELLDHPMTFISATLRSEKNYIAAARDKIMAPAPVSSRHAVELAAAALGTVVFALRWRRGPPRSAVTDLALFGCLLFAVPVLLDTHFLQLGNPVWLGPAVAAFGFVALMVVGTGRLVERSLCSMTLAAFAGLALSTPFIGVDSTRVFAAVLPFAALPFVLATQALARTPWAFAVRAGEPATAPPTEPVARSVDSSVGVRSTDPWWPLAAGGGLMALVLLGTPVAMAVVAGPDTPVRRCPDGQQAEPMVGGVSVRVVNTPPGAARRLDELPLATFSKNVHALAGPFPANQLARITGPATVIFGVTARGDDRIAMVDGDVAAPRSGVLYLCGG